MLGMIIDADGIPVGYELFPGNTFDGKTMVKAFGFCCQGLFLTRKKPNDNGAITPFVRLCNYLVVNCSVAFLAVGLIRSEFSYFPTQPFVFGINATKSFVFGSCFL